MSLWPDSIKQVGRGTHSARDLGYAQAKELFSAILAGVVPDLELGGLLLAYRIKGESAEELRAFADALQAYLPCWQSPSQQYRPVILPCYNGTRKMANLLPVVAHHLAQLGVPVLLHGYAESAAGRHTAAPILQAIGYALPSTLDAAYQQLTAHNLTFIPIDILSPELAALLALRERLGVRHSGHTLAKCIDPFMLNGGGVRVVAPTHPDYAVRYAQLLAVQGAQALLLKATEGEAFAHPTRIETWQVFQSGVASAVHNAAQSSPAAYDLPSVTVTETAEWMQSMSPVLPATLQLQIKLCQSLAVLSGS